MGRRRRHEPLPSRALGVQGSLPPRSSRLARRSPVAAGIVLAGVVEVGRRCQVRIRSTQTPGLGSKTSPRRLGRFQKTRPFVGSRRRRRPLCWPAWGLENPGPHRSWSTRRARPLRGCLQGPAALWCHRAQEYQRASQTSSGRCGYCRYQKFSRERRKNSTHSGSNARVS